MDLLNIPPSEIDEILKKLADKGIIKIEKTKCVLESKSQVDEMAEHLFSAISESLAI
jgi:DNA-binding Lrp family transcriptional regulator